MGNADGAPSKFERWVIGKPRISSSVAWSCIGLAWILLAILQGPTLVRLLLGVAWLASGVFYGVIAVRDRKLGRRFYQRRLASVPRKAGAEE